MRFALFGTVVSCLSLLAAGAPGATADLGGLSIADIINALKVNLVQDINVLINTESFETNKVSVNVDIKNPLIIELTIDRIVNSASLNGTTYATFDHTFDKGFVVPILKTANSGKIPDVTLTKGIDGSLDIIPAGILDITSTVYTRAGTIFGKLGVPITLDGLKQSAVKTNYTLEI